MKYTNKLILALLVGLSVAGIAGGVVGAEWAGVHVPQVQEAFATGFLAHAGVDVAGGVLGGVAGYGIGLGLTRAVGGAGKMISRGR